MRPAVSHVGEEKLFTFGDFGFLSRKMEVSNNLYYKYHNFNSINNEQKNSHASDQRHTN